jgi:hypothetical protein
MVPESTPDVNFFLTAASETGIIVDMNSRRPTILNSVHVPAEHDGGQLYPEHWRCPVESCKEVAHEVDGLECEHEYPGRCAACLTIVGNAYEELTWMGDEVGWICNRCHGFCGECHEHGKAILDGVCGDCCRVVARDGTVLWKPSQGSPSLQLLWDPEAPGQWFPIAGLPGDEDDFCDACGVERVALFQRERELVCWECLLRQERKVA